MDHPVFVPQGDAEDYGHICHPYRDYVEGKADIEIPVTEKKGGPEDAAIS